MELYKHTPRWAVGGSGDKKYYIPCKSLDATESWIKNTSVIDVKNERAIVSALIEDGILRKKQDIVIKIGVSPMIKKEYEYGDKLKEIPGFIRYICAMQCPDDLKRYETGKSIRICSPNHMGEMMNVLVMPSYMKLGSVFHYNWLKHPDQFRSCFIQIFLSLWSAFIKHGFIHGDLHANNVLLSPTRKSHILYSLPNGKTMEVETFGIKVHIMDFDKSLMLVDEKESHALFYDLKHLIDDLLYATRLDSPELQILSNRLDTLSRSKAPAIKIVELISIINEIKEIRKKPDPVLRYNPYI